MSKVSLADVCDEVLGEFKYDREYFKRLKRYQIEYVHANDDHLSFFGGHLLGVYSLRFGYREIDTYFEDILGIDYETMERSVKDVTTINHSFNISSDPMNIAMMYQIHRLLTSKTLGNKDKTEAASIVAMVFSYRVMAALCAKYFRYPIDTETSQAIYERLSGRYLIKKLGTWQAVFEYRGREFVSTDSVHYKALVAFKDDVAIVNAINDLFNRMKDMMKNIYKEFMYVHEHGGKIKSDSGTMVDADGEEIVKDKVHGLENYQKYLIGTMSDVNSFYKQELVDVIGKVIPTVHGKGFSGCLRWMCDELDSKQRGAVVEFVNHVLTIAYEYLSSNSYALNKSKDIVLLTSMLKGFILSSRSESEDLAKFRDEGDTIVRWAVKQTSRQTVSTIRNALFLYVCLRAFTKHAYEH